MSVLFGKLRFLILGQNCVRGFRFSKNFKQDWRFWRDLKGVRRKKTVSGDNHGHKFWDKL